MLSFVRSKGPDILRTVFLLAVIIGMFVRLNHHVSAAAFPTTPVLDDFNRAGTTSPPSANWTAASFANSGTLQLSGDSATAKSSFASLGYAGALWTQQTYGPDSESYATVNTLPGSTNVEVTTLYARYNNAAQSSSNGYQMEVDNTANNQFKVLSTINGVTNQIGTTSFTQAVSAGDSVGMKVTGTGATVNIECWYKASGGSWTQLGIISDSSASRITTSGYIGLETYDPSTKLDNFGGGSAPTFPSTGIIDNFNRANENPLATASSGATWSSTGLFSSSAKLKLVSNQSVASGAGFNNQYITTSYGPNTEAYATIVTPNTGTHVETASLYLRMTNPTSATGQGYECEIDSDQILVNRVNDSGTFPLLLTIAHSTAAGEAIGCSIQGTSSPVTIQVWSKPSGGAWTLLDIASDNFSLTPPTGGNSPYLGAGYLSLEINGTTPVVDDFGGGTTGSIASASNALQDTGQRKMIRSSNGTLLLAYTAGTSESPGGLVFRTSTNNAGSWSSSTQISSSSITDYDIVKDSSDNVYVAYSDSSGSVSVIKLTYSAGSWSVGSPVAISGMAGTACVNGVSPGISYINPTIAVNSSGTLVVNAGRNDLGSGGCGSSFSSTLYSSRSTNGGTTWGSTYTIASATNNAQPSPMLSFSNDIWVVCNNGIIAKDIGTTGAWTTATSGTAFGSLFAPSISASSSDQIDINYGGAGVGSVKGSAYRSYTISTNTLSSQTTLSSSTTDIPGSITSDSSTGDIWVFYLQNVTTNSYNVVYKHFASGTWDSNATNVTTDALNNSYVTSTQQRSGGVVGIGWNVSGTPNTIKATTLVQTNTAPSAPTLLEPANNAVGISTTPIFRLSATDANGDYLQYEIQVCSTSNCSSVVRTICQNATLPNACSASQTGWLSQSLQSATAYSSGQSAAHQYQTPALANNTQYWWRAYAIDPGGTNSASAASGIGSFTTQSASSKDILFQGPICFGNC